MSDFNITLLKNTYSSTPQKNRVVKNNKPDYIPLVTAPQENKIDVTKPMLLDNLSKQIDAMNAWMDKITGLDKVKEFNKLKETLAFVMEQSKIEYSDADLEYWAKIIDTNSKASHLSKELLIALVQRETAFQKCIGSKTGNGPLQVTSITVQDLYSDLNGGRLVHYNNMDKSMMDEILYKEDIAGNKVKRFNNYKELHAACAKDDDLGMKVGIMCFKMKFAEAVAKRKGVSIAEAIEGLKSGEIKLGKNEQHFLIKRSLINFNSVFTDEYADVVLDSIAKISPDSLEGDLNPIRVNNN